MDPRRTQRPPRYQLLKDFIHLVLAVIAGCAWYFHEWTGVPERVASAILILALVLIVWLAPRFWAGMTRASASGVPATQPSVALEVRTSAAKRITRSQRARLTATGLVLRERTVGPNSAVGPGSELDTALAEADVVIAHVDAMMRTCAGVIEAIEDWERARPSRVAIGLNLNPSMEWPYSLRPVRSTNQVRLGEIVNRVRLQGVLTERARERRGRAIERRGLAAAVLIALVSGAAYVQLAVRSAHVREAGITTATGAFMAGVAAISDDSTRTGLRSPAEVRERITRATRAARSLVILLQPSPFAVANVELSDWRLLTFEGPMGDIAFVCRTGGTRDSARVVYFPCGPLSVVGYVVAAAPGWGFWRSRPRPGEPALFAEDGSVLALSNERGNFQPLPGIDLPIGQYSEEPADTLRQGIIAAARRAPTGGRAAVVIDTYDVPDALLDPATRSVIGTLADALKLLPDQVFYTPELTDSMATVGLSLPGTRSRSRKVRTPA